MLSHIVVNSSNDLAASLRKVACEGQDGRSTPSPLSAELPQRGNLGLVTEGMTIPQSLRASSLYTREPIFSFFCNLSPSLVILSGANAQSKNLTIKSNCYAKEILSLTLQDDK